MASIDMKNLGSLLNLLQSLQTICKDNPEVVELAKASQREYGTPVVPVAPDCLLYASEAAKVLHVDKHAIYEFEKKGLIDAYYTPNSSRKKFWLSQIKAIARKEVQNG